MKRIERTLRSIDAKLSNASGFVGLFYRNTVQSEAHYYAVMLGLHPIWKARIQDVLNAPDNAFIPRSRDAGRVIGPNQVMHNGLLIRRDSYYGSPVRLMLERNRGVHEPQEERVFGEVLKFLKPGSTMVELGSYWGFYSLWFLKEVQNGKSFLVEPHLDNLRAGEANFELNSMRGTFIHAFVGSEQAASSDGVVRTVTVDSLCEEYAIDHVNALHSDIQGFEFEMLKGAENTVASGKVDYIFISTHSNDLHQQCTDFLEHRGFVILASANLDESFSLDGLIVARAPSVQLPRPIRIALKEKSLRD